MWTMNEMTEVGALIKQARERKGLTQAALGARIGYSPNFVNRLESGSMTNPPTPQAMRDLERELGVSRRAMLEAMGYLDEEPAGDTITIARDDPRARVVAALEGLPDHAVNQWVVAIEALTNAASQNANRGIHLPDTDQEQSKTA